MLDLSSITTEFLVAANQAVMETGRFYHDPIASVSSAAYYDSVEEQIASIYFQLAKSHYFVDGNKRTSVMVLKYLSKICGLKIINNDKLFDYTINLAETGKSVQVIARDVFI
jgi:death-on-curing family protein